MKTNSIRTRSFYRGARRLTRRDLASFRMTSQFPYFHGASAAGLSPQYSGIDRYEDRMSRGHAVVQHVRRQGFIIAFYGPSMLVVTVGNFRIHGSNVAQNTLKVAERSNSHTYFT